MTGYHGGYSNNDAHLKRLKVVLPASVGAHIDEGYKARVTGVLHLWDAHSDDRFFGSISFLLFGEIGKIQPPVIHG